MTPLLAELARHAGKVLTGYALLTAVWGPESAEEARYRRVYVNRLRHTLEIDPARASCTPNRG